MGDWFGGGDPKSNPELDAMKAKAAQDAADKKKANAEATAENAEQRLRNKRGYRSLLSATNTGAGFKLGQSVMMG